MASAELTRRSFLAGRWPKVIKAPSTDVQVGAEIFLASAGISLPLTGLGEAFMGMLKNNPFMERGGLRIASKYCWTPILTIPLLRRLRPLDRLSILMQEK